MSVGVGPWIDPAVLPDRAYLRARRAARLREWRRVRWARGLGPWLASVLLESPDGGPGLPTGF